MLRQVEQHLGDAGASLDQARGQYARDFSPGSHREAKRTRNSQREPLENFIIKQSPKAREEIGEVPSFGESRPCGERKWSFPPISIPEPVAETPAEPGPETECL